jgi:hypothetical protein
MNKVPVLADGRLVLPPLADGEYTFRSPLFAEEHRISLNANSPTVISVETRETAGLRLRATSEVRIGRQDFGVCIASKAQLPSDITLASDSFMGIMPLVTKIEVDGGIYWFDPSVDQVSAIVGGPALAAKSLEIRLSPGEMIERSLMLVPRRR